MVAAARVADTQHLSTLQVLALTQTDYLILVAGHNAMVRERAAAARKARGGT